MKVKAMTRWFQTSHPCLLGPTTDFWTLYICHICFIGFTLYIIYTVYIMYVCSYFFVSGYSVFSLPLPALPPKYKSTNHRFFPAALKLRCSGQRFHCTKVAWISFGFWTYYILAPVRNCYVTCSQGRAGMNSEALWRLQRVTLACGKLRMRCFWCLFYDILCFYRQQMNFWSGHHLHI